MNIKYVVSLAGLAVLLSAAGPSHADTGKDNQALQIMEQVDAREKGNNQVSDMEMILIDRHGDKRIRKIRAYRKDFGEDTYSISFFLSPADVKNTGFLTYDYDDESRDDDQWLYLPALHKSKRIAQADKSGSFMGSDFNYSDMSSSNIHDFNYSMLKEMDIDGHPVWVIESHAKSKKVSDRTGYNRAILFVRKDINFVIRGIRWEPDGNKLKYFEVKDLRKIDGIWTAMELHMTTKIGDKLMHKTILKFTQVKYNQQSAQNLYTLRRLEQGL